MKVTFATGKGVVDKITALPMLCALMLFLVTAVRREDLQDTASL